MDFIYSLDIGFLIIDFLKIIISVIEESMLILNITTRSFGVISFACDADFPIDF